MANTFKNKHYKKRTKVSYTHSESFDQENVIKRGDVFWVEFPNSEVIGSEQAGLRPVVVISNNTGNRFSPNVIVALLTTKIKKGRIPTHVELSVKDGLPKNSIVLCEQLRTISKERLGEKITNLRANKMEEIDVAIKVSLGLF